MRAVFVVLVLLSGCTRVADVSPTPFPSQEPISEFFARLTPKPTVSPSASVTPSAAPVASSAPARRAPARTAAPSRVFCPSGQVTAEVDDLSASDAGSGRWDVSVSGTATNGTGASVRSVELSVTVHADNARAASYDVTVPQAFGPGGTAGWSGRFRYRSASKPSTDGASAAVTGWSWANSSQATCPT